MFKLMMQLLLKPFTTQTLNLQEFLDKISSIKSVNKIDFELAPNFFSWCKPENPNVIAGHLLFFDARLIINRFTIVQYQHQVFYDLGSLDLYTELGLAEANQIINEEIKNFLRQLRRKINAEIDFDLRNDIYTLTPEYVNLLMR